MCSVQLPSGGLEDVLITVDGPELPLGDGSANIFIDLFKAAGVARRVLRPILN